MYVDTLRDDFTFTFLSPLACVVTQPCSLYVGIRILIAVTIARRLFLHIRSMVCHLDPFLRTLSQTQVQQQANSYSSLGIGLTLINGVKQ
jgi:hypothetical protein